MSQSPPTLPPDAVIGEPAVAADAPAGGRYRLHDEIARGGMGEIHRATDAVLGREVAASADGGRIVTASSDNTARVWDAKTGAVLLTLKHTDYVLPSAFSADGSRIATGSHDGTAKVWDAGPPFRARPAGVAAQPEGNR